MDLVIHPETGELLETRDQFQTALAKLDERLGELYKMRQPLREIYAEKFPAADQPPPRARTQTQDRVARCPRCGVKLESEEAPA